MPDESEVIEKKTITVPLSPKAHLVLSVASAAERKSFGQYLTDLLEAIDLQAAVERLR